MTRNARKRTNSSSRHDRPRWLAEPTPPGLAAEFIGFMLHSKKWWLTPTIVVLLLLSLIAVLSGPGAAPFVYALH